MMAECMVCNVSGVVFTVLFCSPNDTAASFLPLGSWSRNSGCAVSSAKVFEFSSNGIRWQILLVFSAVGLFLLISYSNTKWLERKNFDIFPHCIIEKIGGHCFSFFKLCMLLYFLIPSQTDLFWLVRKSVGINLYQYKSKNKVVK